MVRRDGFAVQDQETAPGLRSVAAPVWNAEGSVVAINVAVNAAEHELAELLVTFRPLVIGTARDISRRLGCPGGILHDVPP